MEILTTTLLSLIVSILFMAFIFELSSFLVYGGFSVNEEEVNFILESESVAINPQSKNIIMEYDNSTTFLTKSGSFIFHKWALLRRESPHKGFRIPRWHPLHKKINKVYANLSKHME